MSRHYPRNVAQRAQQQRAVSPPAAPAADMAFEIDSMADEFGGKTAFLDMQAELSELRDENEKLRDIEKQFWALLTEREDLQRELIELQAASTKGEVGEHAYMKQRTAERLVRQKQQAHSSGGRSTDELEQIKKENDTMACALNECMELLIEKDLGDDILQKRGPVAAFLAWLELGHERNQALSSIEIIRREMRGEKAVAEQSEGSPPPSSSPPPKGSKQDSGSMVEIGPNMIVIPLAEKQALTSQLHQAKVDIQSLQEELDRTDQSRTQALEDAERLQKQMEMLSKNITELRSAYASAKAQAEAGAAGASSAQQLRVRLADKEAENAELRKELAKLQRVSDVGGAQLAADAARIRREMAQRSAERAD